MNRFSMVATSGLLLSLSACSAQTSEPPISLQAAVEADLAEDLCDAAGLAVGETMRVDTGWRAGASRGYLAAGGRHLVLISESTTLDASDPDGSSAVLDGTAQVFVVSLGTSAIERVSVDEAGEPLSGCSLNEGAIDRDATLVTFACGGQIYVHARAAVGALAAHSSVLVTRAEDGSPARGGGSVASVAADAPVLVFNSSSSELVADLAAPRGQESVYVFDARTLELRLASVAADGSVGGGRIGTASIDGEGRYVAWPSDGALVADASSAPFADVAWNIFERDLVSETTSRVTWPASGEDLELPASACEGAAIQCGSFSPHYEPGGRYLVFDSNAGNLDDAVDDTNELFDVFRYDRVSGETRLALRDADATRPPSLMSDAPHVAEDGRVVFRAQEEDGSRSARLWGGPGAGAPIVSLDSSGAPLSLPASADMPNLDASGTLIAFDALGADRRTHVFVRCLGPASGASVEELAATDELVIAPVSTAVSTAVSTTVSTSDSSPRMLSAYVGAIDSRGAYMRAGCVPPAGGGVGMPVVFDVEIEGTPEPGDFLVDYFDRLGRTRRVHPDCVSLAPADEEYEDRTVLVVGDFGDGSAITRVAVTEAGPGEAAHLVSESGELLDGLFVEGADISNIGVTEELVYAEVLPLEELGVDCADVVLGAGQVLVAVQTTWNGGVTGVDGTPIDEDMWPEDYSVVFADDPTPVIPDVLDDRNDVDNNHVLCFARDADAGAPLTVTGAPGFCSPSDFCTTEESTIEIRP